MSFRFLCALSFAASLNLSVGQAPAQADASPGFQAVARTDRNSRIAHEQLLGERRSESAAANEAESYDRWSHVQFPPTRRRAMPGTKKSRLAKAPGTSGFLAFV